MDATITSGQSAAAYGEDVDALDSWDDVAIATQADGDDEVLIDAYPADADPADWPMGRPGIGIRLARAQAVDLACGLLYQCGYSITRDPLSGEITVDVRDGEEA